jgi:hypothetical protein
MQPWRTCREMVSLSIAGRIMPLRCEMLQCVSVTYMKLHIVLEIGEFSNLRIPKV